MNKLVYLFILISLILSCKKDKITTIGITNIDNVTSISAVIHTRIETNPKIKVHTKGICWKRVHMDDFQLISGRNEPTIKDNLLVFDNPTTSINAITIYPIDWNYTYYIKPYVITSEGTFYGPMEKFDFSIKTPSTSDNIPFHPEEALKISKSTQFLNSVNFGLDPGFVPDEKGILLINAATPTLTNTLPSNKFNKGVDDYFYFNGLIPGTTYNYRYYVKSNGIYFYSEILTIETKLIPSPISFNSTSIYNTVSDNEGNEYKTIQIGTQNWMAENLKATRYSNGDLIETQSLVEVVLNDGNPSNNAYQYPVNQDENYVSTYGRFYNYFVIDDSRGICPTGWHIPSREDFIYLKAMTSPSSLAESGGSHWTTDNLSGATNFSGFTAVPSGYVITTISSSFLSNTIGVSADYWTNSPDTVSGDKISNYWLTDDDFKEYFDSKNSKFSIRCIQD